MGSSRWTVGQPLEYHARYCSSPPFPISKLESSAMAYMVDGDLPSGQPVSSFFMIEVAERAECLIVTATLLFYIFACLLRNCLTRILLGLYF
jgi:hypothetical protein